MRLSCAKGGFTCFGIFGATLTPLKIQHSFHCCKNAYAVGFRNQ
jgi:hypothetical protein